MAIEGGERSRGSGEQRGGERQGRRRGVLEVRLLSDGIDLILSLRERSEELTLQNKSSSQDTTDNEHCRPLDWSNLKILRRHILPPNSTKAYH